LEAHAYRRHRGARNSRPGFVRSIPLHLSGNAARGDLRLALFPKEDPENSSAGFGFGAQAIQVNSGEVMKTKKVMRERDEHGPRHVTPAGRSVFYDLFPKAEADELVMRSTLLRGLEQWLKESGLTQTQAAKVLGITQARVSDIKRGKFGQFSLDMLVRLASRAGLKPRLKLAA
jgi:predicted XRE-type DNA-binding protein